MSLTNTPLLENIFIINNKNNIVGLSLVKKGFPGHIHSHKEKELYLCLGGIGELHLDGNIRTIKPGDIFIIPGNIDHAMISKTKYVLLLYIFFTGPFRKIKYNFTGRSML